MMINTSVSFVITAAYRFVDTYSSARIRGTYAEDKADSSRRQSVNRREASWLVCQLNRREVHAAAMLH
jgi:hypothetical protein